MIAAWMLYCTGIALLIGAAAAALERAGRLVGRPGRWVWAGALLATLALPLAARYRAFQSVAIPIPTAQSASATSASPFMTSVRSGVPPRRSVSWDKLDRPLVLLWGCLSFSLLGFFAVGAVRLRRLERHWRPAAIGETPVLVSASLGPAVIGVVRCRLVVPAWTLDLELSLRELMLAHEREHVRAGDPRLLAAARLLLVLMPWNSGLWWQWRRLRLAVEMDCDARVIRTNPDRARYGNLLLEVSQRASHSHLPVAAFHEPMTLLERRIRAITSGRPRWFVGQAAGAAVAAATLMVASCEAPRPEGPTGLREPTPSSAVASTRSLSSDSIFRADSITYIGPRIYIAAQPGYPPLLAQAGIQGVVIVEAIIDTAGRVEPNSLRIVKSPHPGFDQSAKQAILESVYRPASVNGQTVRALIQQPISFPAEPLLRPTRVPEAQPPPLPMVGGASAQGFYLPSAARLTELAERYEPDAFASPGTRPGATIALVFDAQDRVIGHAAGVRETRERDCDAVVKRLLPAFAGTRFASGGCADVVGSREAVVYWGSVRHP